MARSLRSTVTWIDEPEIGKVVRCRVSGPGYDTPQSGVYLGVMLDEEDAVPYHYFVHGEIGGSPQRCFGFPAPLDTKVTDERTPTVVIREALASRKTPVYRVTDLQACEPGLLPRDRGVTVILDPELDGQGFARATLEAPSASALLGYVRENWGDEDKAWFEEYVVQRVELA